CREPVRGGSRRGTGSATPEGLGSAGERAARGPLPQLLGARRRPPSPPPGGPPGGPPAPRTCGGPKPERIDTSTSGTSWKIAPEQTRGCPSPTPGRHAVRPSAARASSPTGDRFLSCPQPGRGALPQEIPAACGVSGAPE